MIPFHSRPPAPSTDAIRISNMCCVLCDMNEQPNSVYFLSSGLSVECLINHGLCHWHRGKRIAMAAINRDGTKSALLLACAMSISDERQGW